ncbi:unnamed protein product, partial [Schistocephalus solidus]|uniref:ULP_PROTEASE domain-containing protein n=1 Tax=Schistocephalus solidus TaxID=70667 RepID=A0A183T9X7_SCHSO
MAETETYKGGQAAEQRSSLRNTSNARRYPVLLFHRRNNCGRLRQDDDKDKKDVKKQVMGKAGDVIKENRKFFSDDEMGKKIAELSKERVELFKDCHTSRRLGTHINEQKVSSVDVISLSPVIAHAVDFDHRLNWDGNEVVTTASTKQVQKFLEAWYSETDSINRHVDLDARYEDLYLNLFRAIPKVLNVHLRGNESDIEDGSKTPEGIAKRSMPVIGRQRIQMDAEETIANAKELWQMSGTPVGSRSNSLAPGDARRTLPLSGSSLDVKSAPAGEVAEYEVTVGRTAGIINQTEDQKLGVWDGDNERRGPENRLNGQGQNTEKDGETNSYTDSLTSQEGSRERSDHELRLIDNLSANKDRDDQRRPAIPMTTVEGLSYTGVRGPEDGSRNEGGSEAKSIQGGTVPRASSERSTTFRLPDIYPPLFRSPSDVAGSGGERRPDFRPNDRQFANQDQDDQRRSAIPIIQVEGLAYTGVRGPEDGRHNQGSSQKRSDEVGPVPRDASGQPIAFRRLEIITPYIQDSSGAEKTGPEEQRRPDFRPIDSQSGNQDGGDKRRSWIPLINFQRPSYTKVEGPQNGQRTASGSAARSSENGIAPREASGKPITFRLPVIPPSIRHTHDIAADVESGEKRPWKPEINQAWPKMPE